MEGGRDKFLSEILKGGTGVIRYSVFRYCRRIEIQRDLIHKRSHGKNATLI